MRPTLTRPLLALATLCFAGCTRRPPVSPAATLTDELGVKLHSTAGVGVALRLDGTVFHVGQPVPVHIALQNFAATTPLQGTPCNGLTLSFTHIDIGRSVVGQPRIPTCAPQTLDPPPLPRGKLFTIDTDLSTALQESLPAGTYQVMAAWQPSVARTLPIGPHGENLFPPPYAVARSAIQQIVILP